MSRDDDDQNAPSGDPENRIRHRFDAGRADRYVVRAHRASSWAPRRSGERRGWARRGSWWHRLLRPPPRAAAASPLCCQGAPRLLLLVMLLVLGAVGRLAIGSRWEWGAEREVQTEARWSFWDATL